MHERERQEYAKYMDDLNYLKRVPDHHLKCVTCINFRMVTLIILNMSQQFVRTVMLAFIAE